MRSEGGDQGIFSAMRASVIISLAMVMLLAGCANTPLGRSVREGFYTQARAIDAYNGEVQKDVPKSTECQFTQLIGQPLSAVTECFGKPSVYALGVEGDGHVSYQLGLYGLRASMVGNPDRGFTVLLSKGKVADIVRY